MANTLFDLAQQYLQQGLPDITGIFPPPPKTIGPVLPVLPEEPIEKPTGIETLFQTGRGPNDEFRGGGGRFGDLDLSDSKTVTRNVYTKLAPGRYEFVPTEIKAFRNMRSGLYQTEDGKNVDAMFTDAPTGGVLQLISNIFDPRQIGAEYPLGKIQGTYTNLASLLKGERNPTGLVTAARQRLIDQGSQIAEEFAGQGEFPTPETPKKPKRGVPTGVGGKTPGPKKEDRGGTPDRGSGGGGGFGAADFGNFSDDITGAL
jgi:hypothetical protein